MNAQHRTKEQANLHTSYNRPSGRSYLLLVFFLLFIFSVVPVILVKAYMEGSRGTPKTVPQRLKTELANRNNLEDNINQKPKKDKTYDGMITDIMEKSFPLRMSIITGYSTIKSTLNTVLYNTFASSVPLIPLDDPEKIRFRQKSSNDNIITPPYARTPGADEALKKRIQSFNRLAQMLPGQNIYLYMVRTMDFSDIYRELGAEYSHDGPNMVNRFFSGLDKSINYDSLDYDLNAFRRYFYKTDHHWTVEGAYQGYKEIMAMIGKKDGQAAQSLMPKDYYKLPDIQFRGTHASKAAYLPISDDFYAFNFNHIKSNTYIDGIPLPRNDKDMFAQAEGIIKQPFTNDYALYYGFDFGLVKYESSKKGKNLLIFADSSSNCIEQLFTGYYANVYAVDLRHYSDELGEKFDVQKFVRDNKINDILFLYLADRMMLDVDKHNVDELVGD